MLLLNLFVISILVVLLVHGAEIAFNSIKNHGADSE
jgi:hypothetical protein